MKKPTRRRAPAPMEIQPREMISGAAQMHPIMPVAGDSPVGPMPKKPHLKGKSVAASAHAEETRRTSLKSQRAKLAKRAASAGEKYS